MIRIIIAIVLVLHGLIHLLGFVVPWRLATVEAMPYTTTVFAGRITVGDTGIRVVGLLWLAAAIGYVAAGLGLMMLFPWWPGLTVGVTLFSLALCLLGWPDAQVGVYLDLIILAYLMIGSQSDWLLRF